MTVARDGITALHDRRSTRSKGRRFVRRTPRPRARRRAAGRPRARHTPGRCHSTRRSPGPVSTLPRGEVTRLVVASRPWRSLPQARARKTSIRDQFALRRIIDDARRNQWIPHRVSGSLPVVTETTTDNNESEDAHEPLW
jgi:hypothetical protein